MADDKGTGPAHHPGARKGEEMSSGEGKEAGRHDVESSSGTGRPAGKSTGRDSTGISPDAENPIDPKSPHMPTP